jgi:hypothetical protein
MQGLYSPQDMETLQRLGLSEAVVVKLLTRPDLAERVEAMIASVEEEERQGPADKPGAFVDSLRDRFQQPGKVELIEDEFLPSGTVGNPETRRERILEEIEEKQKQGGVKRALRPIPSYIWDRKDSAVRQFLLEQYLGHCQICDSTFPKRDGTPYFEGVYLAERLKGEWRDREGNVLCLCADCSAKVQFGTFEVQNLEDQILAFRPRAEGGDGHPRIYCLLIGQPACIRYTEKHMLDLQLMVQADLDASDAPESAIA